MIDLLPFLTKLRRLIHFSLKLIFSLWWKSVFLNLFIVQIDGFLLGPDLRAHSITVQIGTSSFSHYSWSSDSYRVSFNAFNQIIFFTDPAVHILSSCIGLLCSNHIVIETHSQVFWASIHRISFCILELSVFSRNCLRTQP